MRVLLLDEGFLSGALAARGLARAGCTVDVLAATGGRGRCASGGGTWWLAPRVDDLRLPAAIDAVVARGGYDVVYPVTEPLQALAWDMRGAWEALVFPAVDEAHRSLRRDKRLMSAHVAAHGVPIPRQRTAQDDDAVCDAVRALGLPVVVKGARGRGGKATRICATMDSAIASARRLRAAALVPFVQELVPGVTHLVGGLFDRGRPLRLYAAAKVAQVPARVGPAAVLRSVHDAALLDVALRAAEAAEVTGLASMDLVRTPAGDVRFLELNPRPWGSIEAARGAGVELFAPLAALMRGEAVDARLEWTAGATHEVFPLYPIAGAPLGALSLLRSLGRDARRMGTIEPGLAAHLAHRLVRMGLNW